MAGQSQSPKTTGGGERRELFTFFLGAMARVFSALLPGRARGEEEEEQREEKAAVADPIAAISPAPESLLCCLA